MNKKLYDLVKSQFPINETYRSRMWIFPHHIDIMLDLLNEIDLSFNRDICEAAIILHDVGLVYKRDLKDAVGHEARSVEFAKFALKGESDEFVLRVIDCIRATESDCEPESIEEKIVRTLDSFSQINSFHFFAKAYFAHDLDWFVNWFDTKVKASYDKICIEPFISRAKPIQELYERLIKEYKQRLNDNLK